MSSSASRNMPCPCGSGRKRKKCCLAPASAGGSRSSITDEVAAYALRRTGVADLQVAWEEFGETGSVKRPDGRRFGLFMDWLITGRRREGLTILQRFEAERGASLTAEDRAELEKHKATGIGVYEVVAVRPGTGLTVKDIFTDEEVAVADVSASRGASIWDVLVLRLRRMGGPAQAWGEAMLFSPINKAELKFELEGAYRVAKTCEPSLEWQAFLNSASPLIRKLQASFLTRRQVSAVVTERSSGANTLRVVATVALKRAKLWPDQPVPALGGRTPREAAKDAHGRTLLADLLKEYENRQERTPTGQDVSGLVNVPEIVWMRKALGQAIPKALAALEQRLIAAAARP